MDFEQAKGPRGGARNMVCEFVKALSIRYGVGILAILSILPCLLTYVSKRIIGKHIMNCKELAEAPSISNFWLPIGVLNSLCVVSPASSMLSDRVCDHDVLALA